ncbi:hypothetical protein CYLTODRAFT_20041 [Cylindrobasidium torrendii FP15055 ss-10]|uniref:Uncharacterized protein n=1 Tax=Cylindrobasidium torrendii FP15055 ss-10 TaxID=1314674 RepID=A0A0D7BSZ7_9AGAR|nr:hypothetical protein CYLTODRAFT_20041 [Cylindrobasidium torrendii FP15055 ss-10]
MENPARHCAKCLICHSSTSLDERLAEDHSLPLARSHCGPNSGPSDPYEWCGWPPSAYARRHCMAITKTFDKRPLANHPSL